MRAERLTGYFVTSASKREASWGENTDMDSLAMHQLPGPGLCCHVHFFFLTFAGSQPPGFRQPQRSCSSILSLPVYPRAVAIQIQPRIAVPHCDSFFPQLDCSLTVA